MSVEKVETLIIGGGQAGLAASRHLGKQGREHLVVERKRIAERWRAELPDPLQSGYRADRIGPCALFPEHRSLCEGPPGR